MLSSIGALLLPAVAWAADQLFTKAPVVPAFETYGVDGLNAKIDGFGGEIGGRAIGGVKGAVTAPISGPYGVQVDFSAGDLDSRAFGSIGGHLFWRNPTTALFGLYVNHVTWDMLGGVHATQVAGEGEYFIGRWTLQGIAGVEFGNSVSTAASVTTTIAPQIGVPGLVTTTTLVQGFDIKTRFFDQVNVKYYLTDNWDGYVGHRYLGGANALALGTEYGAPIARNVMASAFLEGRVGEKNYNGVWGGLRFYFGKDKPLIQRHRSEDPTLWDSLFTILNNQTQGVFQSQTSIPALAPPPPPPPPPPPDCGGEGC
jgi:hypothetical protein